MCAKTNLYRRRTEGKVRANDHPVLEETDPNPAERKCLSHQVFVEFWAQGLRVELAPLGIKVTNIQPGNVSTELLLHNRDAAALAEIGSPPENPMLEPSDIAEAIAYAKTRKSNCAVNEVTDQHTDVIVWFFYPFTPHISRCARLQPLRRCVRRSSSSRPENRVEVSSRRRRRCAAL